MKKINVSKISFLSIGFLSVVLFASLVLPQQSEALITNILGVGSRGADVTELQQFLATNPSIYPEGIVSGYYGGLTRNAVMQFQAAYDIAQVGTVGPITGAKINSLMSSGFGLDTKAPIITSASVQTSNDDATVSWSTNEIARGQVFYSTSPITANEATGHAQLPFISGTLASGAAGFSQSINLSNLQSNTQYYYVTRAIDNSGNVTMSLLRTFKTD